MIMKNIIERLRKVLDSSTELKAQVEKLYKLVAIKDVKIGNLEDMLNKSENDFILTYKELQDAKAEIIEKEEEIANKEEAIESLIEESIKFEEEIKTLKDEIVAKEKSRVEDLKALEEVVSELETLFVEEKEEK